MLNWFIGLVSGLLIAFGIMLIAQPNCPAEDSCQPDYVKVNVGPVHFGYWTGKEVTP